MSHLEKHRLILLALAALTLIAFVGLRGYQPEARSPVGLGETETPVTDETATSNCGHCISQTGAMVSCYKPTQMYTCTSRATPCANLCQ
jgi:hypothetical protein